jgi:hypothetical protein
MLSEIMMKMTSEEEKEEKRGCLDVGRRASKTRRPA